MAAILKFAPASRPSNGGASELSPFPVEQTYSPSLSSTSKVVLDSRDLGWRNAYATLTAARAWSGRVPAIEHPGVIYCMRGVNRVERKIEGEAKAETVTFRPRQLAFFPTHAASSFDVRGGADVLVIYLRGAMVRDIAERAFAIRAERIHFRPRMAFLDPLLEQLCLGVVSALQRRDPAGDSAYVDHLAETIAVHCLRHYGVRDARPESATLSTLPLSACLQRVCDHVENHLGDDLSLERLARHADLKPATLTQAFRATFGVTPHQWILSRRIERAARLIADTNLPLAEIALDTGFASQSHLSTMFKRHMRQTPQGYRMGR